MKSKRDVFHLGVLFLLVAVFGTSSLSAPSGRETTAADLIAKQLPEKKTLRNANQMEFLSAVCAAARKRRANTAAITQAAVQARRELAGEIVGMVLRCAGKPNCETTGAIVAAAYAAEGDESKITDAAIAKAPDCAEAIREATRRAAKPSPAPKSAPEPESLIGTSSGRDEGFDPHEPLKLVCVGGTQRAVRTSQFDEFLKANPGAVPGPCPTSPAKNR